MAAGIYVLASRNGGEMRLMPGRLDGHRIRFVALTEHWYPIMMFLLRWAQLRRLVATALVLHTRYHLSGQKKRKGKERET